MGDLLDWALGRSEPRSLAKEPYARRSASAVTQMLRPDRRQCTSRLVQVETVVAGGQCEGEAVALRPALAVHTDPLAIGSRRPAPQAKVRGAQRLGGGGELPGYLDRVVQTVGP